MRILCLKCHKFFALTTRPMGYTCLCQNNTLINSTLVVKNTQSNNLLTNALFNKFNSMKTIQHNLNLLKFFLRVIKSFSCLARGDESRRKLLSNSHLSNS
ncbi:hypothetical protein OS493_025947 [Desmophyllum pertusum]|uniref:Uncharacterized protein n=1 Tax=Desmophyllum pertusum TaxID=174260 RepID=A0A9X0CKL7_9CNID|nr:hypothetical protein OS493_025947 [Desmophyllum pertusum]